ATTETAIPNSSSPPPEGGVSSLVVVRNRGARQAPGTGRSVAEKRARVVARVERAKVLEPLAHPDELHGQSELVRDGERDAAFGRSVELRQDDPPHPPRP